VNSGQTQNDSEYSITPVTSGRQSIASHETVILPSNNDSSKQSLSQNHSAIPSPNTINRDLVSMQSFHSRSNIEKISSNSIKHVNESPRDTKPHISINSNPITKHRRYRITILHTEPLLDMPSNDCTTATKVIFAISIVIDFCMFHLVYQTTLNSI